MGNHVLEYFVSEALRTFSSVVILVLEKMDLHPKSWTVQARAASTLVILFRTAVRSAIRPTKWLYCFGVATRVKEKSALRDDDDRRFHSQKATMMRRKKAHMSVRTPLDARERC